VLFKKLASQSAEQFRDMDIDEFDLNITEHVEDAEEIDSTVSPLIYAAFLGTPTLTKASKK
jgi:hypothetical protein